MKANISNFRGIKQAEIQLSGIVLIGGQNGAGKSSIAQALTGCLTGSTPISGVKKADYYQFVYSGAATAQAEVSNDSGRATISYPKGETFREGEHPQASAYATGLLSPLDMEPRKAAEAWADILQTVPEPEAIVAHLKELGIETGVQAVVDLIKYHGWDGALAAYKEEGSKLKGRWEQVTGERYGTKKADSWVPEGFSIDQASLKEDALEAAVTAAHTRHTEAMKTIAVADDALVKLRADAESLKERQADMAKTEDALTKAGDEYSAAIKAQGVLPGVSRAPLSCPHCKKLVELSGGELIIAERLTSDELAERTRAHEVAAKRVAAARESMDNLTRAVMLAKQGVAASDAASKKINSAPAGRKANTEETERELRKAKFTYEAWQAYHTAREMQHKILWHIRIVETLAPEGLRKRHLDEALGRFNASLTKFCSTAGWAGVRVEPDLSVSYGDRPYAMLSESEQYKARVTLQTAIGTGDHSDVLLFDRVDILTSNGRNGLFRMCKNLCICCVLFMSANSATDIPKLTADGISYWAQAGTCSPIS